MKHHLPERCLLLYQSYLMLANDFRRYGGTGVVREGKKGNRTAKCLDR